MAVEQPRALASGHSGQEESPLRGYATLMGVFVSVVGAFSTWIHRSGRELPERVSSGDLALITIGTHKAARLLAKDKVTSAVRAPFTRLQSGGGPGEVQEQPRGEGLRRAVGELLSCPYCLSMWISTAFLAGLTVIPRPTRWAASVLAATFGSDVLQVAYRKLEEAV